MPQTSDFPPQPGKNRTDRHCKELTYIPLIFRGMFLVAKMPLLGYDIHKHTFSGGYLMPNEESLEQYVTAYKAGHKEYKKRLAAGLDPHPAVLDEMIPQTCCDTYLDIGLVDIPVERIIGTRSAGRITAFSASFLPLLPPDTEFAAKWLFLCNAHLSPEGLRDPILCYEYLGNFYVQEGNKRLSVLRSFGATRIPGTVRRILPAPSDEPYIKAYYEFLDFYKDSEIYDVQYRTPGNYAKLLSFLGKEPGTVWTQWEQRTFRAYFQYFQDAFLSLGGQKLSLSPEEALLIWLELHSFRELGRLTDSELKKSLSALWKDLQVLSQDEPVQVNTEPLCTKWILCPALGSEDTTRDASI